MGLDERGRTLTEALFAGVRIVELAQYVFVPAATVLLADQGAEVIKVEAPDGDPYRTIRIGDGRETASANLAMEQNNRGKKSIALDLKSEAGREAFLRLIETADVFVTSLRPRALRKLRIEVADLRLRNPRLIYARGNGLGFRGEEADRAGYDASAFWARGGFADLLTRSDAPAPTRVRPAMGDHASATSLALGIVSALFRRGRTGEASVVEASLLANAAWILSSDLVVSQAADPGAGEDLRDELRFPLQRSYRTADGRWIQIMILAPDRHWPQLCRLIGMAEAACDPRFATMEGRTENGPALCAMISRRIGARPWAEWEPLFQQWDAPWELIRTIHEVGNDPQVRDNGMLFDVTVEDGTDVTLVSGPVSIDGQAMPAIPLRAPLLGEHGEALLASLGYGAEDMASMRAAGALA